ncbi:MAG: NusG domain II-containing protein [Clostridium sp.]|nr:NusG domain II-containing protein [Clostridium sp.]
MLKSSAKHSITKADILLLCALLASAFLVLILMGKYRTPGSYLEISCDGVLLGSIPLTGQEEAYYLLAEAVSEAEISAAPASESGAANEAETSVSESGAFTDTRMTLYKLTKDADEEWAQTIARIEEECQNSAYNILVCQNGEARMLKADCSDQICVHHYPVSASGENIICLPHKIVLAVTGDKISELDGVAY